MATIVGLKSGKEFIVKDGSFILSNPEDRVYVFISEDDKRMFTINQQDIEFFNETKTEQRVDLLQKIADKVIEPDTSYNRDVV